MPPSPGHRTKIKLTKDIQKTSWHLLNALCMLHLRLYVQGQMQTPEVFYKKMCSQWRPQRAALLKK